MLVGGVGVAQELHVLFRSGLVVEVREDRPRFWRERVTRFVPVLSVGIARLGHGGVDRLPPERRVGSVGESLGRNPRVLEDRVGQRQMETRSRFLAELSGELR